MQFLSLGIVPPPDTEDTRVRETGSNGSKPSAVPQTAALNELPPAIEQLRERLSNKVGPAPHTPLAGSVNSLALAERGAVPTFGTFKFGYVPARGLLYSVIGHEVALFALFLIFTYGLPALRPQKLLVRANSQDRVIYLPELGGGTEGVKTPGGGPTAAPQLSAAPAHASKGFAYPGRQSILSDPPNPTNAFQTLQRPLLVHPAPLSNSMCFWAMTTSFRKQAGSRSFVRSRMMAHRLLASSRSARATTEHS